MSGESVKISVRVRAFKDEEERRTNTLCIDMPSDKMVVVKDVNMEKEDRAFSFDHAFWSFDGFTQDESGYRRPDNEKYADQRKVWDCLGTVILEKAWMGLNCTLFAYGQTGSGKSFSIFGYGGDKGIVPNACSEIFKRIDTN